MGRVRIENFGMTGLKIHPQMVGKGVDRNGRHGTLLFHAEEIRRDSHRYGTQGGLMKTRLLSMADVARESMVPRHRISYALEIGLLREPPRVGGRRCFGPRDLEAIRTHFGKASPNERQ